MNNIDIAKELLHIEAKSISDLVNRLNDSFNKIINSILNSKGKLIVSGMGKSGLIGKKIAATLASTGTPSFFLHPAEAYHGDLGMIEPDDILLLLSYSGETDEVLRLIPFLKDQQNCIISMSGDSYSSLAKNSDYHIDISVEQEACPLQLAPTSSTTATLAMGDAMAVVLMRARGFEDNHFARLHPGGSLGRRLLTRVRDIVRSDNLPICTPETPIKDIISTITTAKLGLCIIIQNSDIQGIITDGDIRRAMDRYESSFFSLKAIDIMTPNPKSITLDRKILEANDIMSHHKINSLIVTDSNGELMGVVQMYDIGA